MSDYDGNRVIDVEEYRYRMLEIFVFFDKDGDGFIVVAEVPEEKKALHAVIDSNDDEKISVREFLLFSMPRFWKADYDGDNVLSRPEVAASNAREATGN